MFVIFVFVTNILVDFSDVFLNGIPANISFAARDGLIAHQHFERTGLARAVDTEQPETFTVTYA